MSSHSSNTNGDPGFGLTPEELAPIAAVEGLGALTNAELDDVDLAEVARFEAAAGVLFAAVELRDRHGADELQSAEASAPPAGMLERLQQAAELHVSSRMGDSPSSVERALGVADAANHRSQSGAGASAQSRHGEDPSRRTMTPSEFHRGASGGDSPSVDPASSGPTNEGALGSSSSSGIGGLAAFAGWAAAAALLVGLLFSIDRVTKLEEGTADLAPDKQLAQLELLAADVQTLKWLPLGGGSAPKGSVIWSDEQNSGFMKINGLAANDPSQSQYQLWIFRGTDPGAEMHPVDGGVFDVQGSGEVIISIDAKLQVGSAGTFAVTVEKPGGVVVSDREQIVLLAQRAS